MTVIDLDVRARLVDDQDWWDMPMIAVALAVSHQTVKLWRTHRLAELAGRRPSTGAPDPNTLPDPDITMSGKPMWRAGTIRRWAMQTGRMTPAGVPVRRKPPGRPRSQQPAAA